MSEAAQLLLEGPAVGEVEQDAGDRQITTQPDQATVDLDAKVASVLAESGELVADGGLALLEPPAHGLPDPLPVLLGGQVHRPEAAFDFVHRVPEDAREGRVDGREKAVLDDVDTGEPLLDQRVDHGLAIGQPPGGVLELGHVGDEPLEPQEVAVHRVDGVPLLPDVPDLAVGRCDPVLKLERGSTGGEGALDLVPHALPVVGMDEVPVGHASGPHQVRGVVAGQRPTALAHELHRPVGIVPALVGHAGQTTQEARARRPAGLDPVRSSRARAGGRFRSGHGGRSSVCGTDVLSSKLRTAFFRRAGFCHGRSRAARQPRRPLPSFLLGSRQEQNEAGLHEFLSNPAVKTLVVDDEVARHYAAIVADLRRAGTPRLTIGACDGRRLPTRTAPSPARGPSRPRPPGPSVARSSPANPEAPG